MAEQMPLGFWMQNSKEHFGRQNCSIAWSCSLEMISGETENNNKNTVTPHHTAIKSHMSAIEFRFNISLSQYTRSVTHDVTELSYGNSTRF